MDHVRSSSSVTLHAPIMGVCVCVSCRCSGRISQCSTRCLSLGDFGHHAWYCTSEQGGLMELKWVPPRGSRSPENSKNDSIFS